MTGARWRPGLGEPVFSADAVQVIAQVMMRSGVASKSLPSGPRVAVILPICISKARIRHAVCKSSRRSRYRGENRNDSQLKARQAQSMTEFEILDRHTSGASIPAKVETRVSRGVPLQTRRRLARSISSLINHEDHEICLDDTLRREV
jgi:hypothetical protein